MKRIAFSPMLLLRTGLAKPLSACILLISVGATASFGSVPSQDLAFVQHQVFSDWAPSSPTTEPIVISVHCGKHGRMSETKFEKRSSNLQWDTDALQAVLSASGFPVYNEDSTFRFEFRPSLSSQFKRNGIAEFRASHPNLPKDAICFYRIPLYALRFVPGTFSEDQLISEQNVGVLCVANNNEAGRKLAQQSLERIYLKGWTEFFLSHNGFTAAQLDEFMRKNHI